MFDMLLFKKFNYDYNIYCTYGQLFYLVYQADNKKKSVDKKIIISYRNDFIFVVFIQNKCYV